MSINHTLKTQPVSPAHIQQEVKLNQRNLANGTKNSPFTTEKGSDVKLSALTQHIKTDSSRDVNMERVQQIKEAIRNGDLKMDYEKIAQALLQNILDDR